ncbi:MAG: glycoside hydrolase family 3 C-terminal domain-containing protein [Firmicutes bacterium]|nr:glycoside hydrolase family 3 C-terminal domain-containing protein [Bacillota bacterium]
MTKNLKKIIKRTLFVQLTIALIIIMALGCANTRVQQASAFSGDRARYNFESYTLAQEAPFEYFKTEFGSIAELKEEAHAVSRQVQSEGAVLLMNNMVGGRPALPLSRQTGGRPTHLSLFDVTSVDPIWGGMGSGMAAVTGARRANTNSIFTMPTGGGWAQKVLGGYEATGKYGIFDSPSFPVATSRQSWRTSLLREGFTINEQLWDWYDGLPRARTSAQTGSAIQGNHPVLRGTTTYRHMATFNIGGASWGQMPTHKYDQADVGIFFLGRMGGEDFDRQMLSWDQGVPLPAHLGGTLNDGGNTERSYLRLSDRERTVLLELAQMRADGRLSKLILVINASNQPELDWLTQNNEFNFDAAMWVGGLGQDGICGIVDLLVGNESPSGRLPKVFWNEHADNPVHANFGSFSYGTGVMNRNTAGGADNVGGGQPSRYVVYQEGMYLGYRYTETRYVDMVMGRGNALANGRWDGSNFNYREVVAFPFGFGLSYTEFTYSNMSVSRRDITTTPVRPAAGRENVRINKTFYDVTVTVRNSGQVAGRETVKVYLQRPYTEYHIANGIEIPAVELAGFHKTPILQPGQSYTVTIEVDEQYFAAFDANSARTWVATGGEYFLSVANSHYGSHQAVNNILANKGFTVANGMTFNGTANMAVRISHDTPVRHDFGSSTTTLNEVGRTKYAVSRVTGVAVTALFDNADINRFAAAQTDSRNSVTYISRNDWAGTTVFVNPLAREAAQTNQTVIHRTPEMFAMMERERSQVTDEVLGAYPTMGAEYGIMFADMAVRNPDGTLLYDFNHPRWQRFLDQLTWDDYIWLLSDALRRTMDIATVGKPRSQEVNGPIGFSPRYGNSFYANTYRHYSFPASTHPGGGFYVNFGVGEKDPHTIGFANIGVFWVPNFYGPGEGAFIPRRNTDWHRDLYRDVYGREMQQIVDKDHIAYTTSFPSNPVLAATFNEDLIRRLGNMIGEDALWAGYSGIYGTGINILRSAHLGRVFEYYSECGFLTGMMASAWTRGVQEKGTYVYNKHFVLNEQELSRYGISQFINEQTLREIYLRAFEIPIVRDDARAIMATLARVGVEYGPASYALMTSWLRGEVGFTGFTVTDWWLGHHHLEPGTGSEAFLFNTGYYMNLSRTLLAGNDLPDGVIGHVQLDFFRPEGQPRSPFISGSSLAMHAHYDYVNSVWSPITNRMTIHPGGGGATVAYEHPDFDAPIRLAPMVFNCPTRGAITRVHNADIARAMRASAHRIMYTTANSNLSNALFNDERVRAVRIPGTTTEPGGTTDTGDTGCQGCGSAIISEGNAVILAIMAGIIALTLGGFMIYNAIAKKKSTDVTKE